MVSLNNYPMVSVLMITYNHELYIAQAIEGVLMQKVDFEMELVIGEDCSNDSTRAICENYASQYPDKIRLLPSDRNQGMMPNFLRTLDSCHGKYIAMCEGDDYWTDPLKLKKQVDFLENNSDFSLCIHDVITIYEGVPKENPFSCNWTKSTFTFSDVIDNHFIPTLSIVSRRNHIIPIPHWFVNCIVGDIPLELILLSKGDGFYFHETMGVKRKNIDGITADKERLKKRVRSFYDMYKNINCFTEKKYNKNLKPKIASYERKIAITRFEQRKIILGLIYVLKSFIRDPVQVHKNLNLNKLRFVSKIIFKREKVINQKDKERGIAS